MLEQESHPITSLMASLCKHGLERPMHAFDDPVPLWVVRGSCDFTTT